MKIFVDADLDVRLARRIRRDMESRGRDLAGILQQYEQFVKPSTETFVVPTKGDDRVVPRGAENEAGDLLIANHINQLLDEEVDALLKADGLVATMSSMSRSGILAVHVHRSCSCLDRWCVWSAASRTAPERIIV